jgi:hypothetical protein
MPPPKSSTPRARPSVPTTHSWPSAVATMVRHLRPYLGVALVMLAVALGVVLLRANHLALGPVQVTRTQ